MDEVLDAEPWTPDYGPAALARLAMSVAARELSDSARAVVPTVGSYNRSGESIQTVTRIAAAAREVLALAVVHERLRGTTWAEIGESLGGITRQAAQDRYGAQVTQFRAHLVRAWLNPEDLVPLLGEYPASVRHRLNLWAARHRERGDRALGPDPVGAGLPAATVLDGSALLLEAADLLRQIRDAHSATNGPGAGQEACPDRTDTAELQTLEMGYARRKVGLLERMLAEGRDDVADALLGARARLDQLQAQQVRARVRAAYRSLARRPQEWIRLAVLREYLADVARADVDTELRRMAMRPEGGVHLAPEAEKRLTDKDREAALTLDGTDQHLIAMDEEAVR